MFLCESEVYYTFLTSKYLLITLLSEQCTHFLLKLVFKDKMHLTYTVRLESLEMITFSGE